jgi:ABC-type branched-subunit amino acid transport system substrate-binding protein
VVLPANAPTPRAASRAARRLIAAGNIHAVVGGIGEGQAGMLSAICDEAQILFFNIGSSETSLRRLSLRRFTFHIEASAAMYLDAMVSWGASQGYRRWFIVHEDTEEGSFLARRAAWAVDCHGDGGASVVGAASAIPRQPFYGPQLDAARNEGADAILVLLSDVDQVAFVAQQANLDPIIPAVLFPHPNTQTRDYMAAFREMTRRSGADSRFVLWDPTLELNGAAEFNTRYISRWADPADPPAWSAYHAIKIVYEAAFAVGTADGPTLVDYLENGDREFDLLKGSGTSFRPWDHQLRQPIYLTRIDNNAEWDRQVPSSRVAIAHYAATLPDDVSPGIEQSERLDQFGDGPTGPNCTEAM